MIVIQPWGEVTVATANDDWQSHSYLQRAGGIEGLSKMSYVLGVVRRNVGAG